MVQIFLLHHLQIQQWVEVTKMNEEQYRDIKNDLQKIKINGYIRTGLAIAVMFGLTSIVIKMFK